MDHCKACMMKLVLHSNWHLHAVTPAKEEQWRAWNNACRHRMHQHRDCLWNEWRGSQWSCHKGSTDARLLLI